MSTTTPEDFKLNAQGHLVPIETIRPIDLARDDLVKEIVTKAKEMSAALAQFKGHAFNDIAAFVELSAERYEVKVGGQKGNVTLLSFDGRYKVQRAMSDTMTFDEGLLAAKALIDECLHDWTINARVELRAIIDNAFAVDKEGNINTGRILSLRRLDIKDERWKRAMDALNDSVQVQNSKAYVRVYERVGSSDKYVPIALDVAGV